MMFSR